MTLTNSAFQNPMRDTAILDMVNDWLVAYRNMCSHKPNVLEFTDHGFIFLYDLNCEFHPEVDDRLVAAYGLSSPNSNRRDTARMRGFLGGGINIAGRGCFDKGHALAHGIGGGLDANLFPQRPDLNRGRSEAGRRYRSMERFAAANPSTFVYSRLIYNDPTWVPSALEYGVRLADGKMWVECFDNI